MPDNQRIKDLIAYLKDNRYIRNQQDFTERIGSNKSTVSQIINNRISVPNNMFAGIKAAFPIVSVDWLKNGEGEMLVDAAPVGAVETISYTDGVPYYDEDFLLGFDEIIAPGSENPEYLINMPGYERATLWCNASGHSMEPEINNGDIIALQRVEDFSFLPFGEIYGIITTNGFRTIKRLGRAEREGYYRLIPTNPAYDTQEIPVSKIALVYRLMGAMKRF